MEFRTKLYGITPEFKFNFDEDKVDDYLDLTKYLHKSTRFGDIYWFGYEFKSYADSNVRTQIIDMIRGISNRDLSDLDKRRFVEQPLIELSKEAPMREIEAVVYPDSKKSDLNKYQYELITRYFRVKDMVNIELIKGAIDEIEFDYNLYFEQKEFPHESARKQAEESIKEMMDKIKDLDYFHIAKWKTKYRPFFRNYLKFRDSRADLNKYKKIMILDDISTTGSTLDYMITLCRTINPDLKIYIYSLIGKR